VPQFRVRLFESSKQSIENRLCVITHWEELACFLLLELDAKLRKERNGSLNAKPSEHFANRRSACASILLFINDVVCDVASTASSNQNLRADLLCAIHRNHATFPPLCSQHARCVNGGKQPGCASANNAHVTCLPMFALDEITTFRLHPPSLRATIVHAWRMARTEVNRAKA
jgi:hypothetical protein